MPVRWAVQNRKVCDNQVRKFADYGTVGATLEQKQQQVSSWAPVLPDTFSQQAGICGHEEPPNQIMHDHVQELNEKRLRVRALLRGVSRKMAANANAFSNLSTGLGIALQPFPAAKCSQAFLLACSCSPWWYAHQNYPLPWMQELRENAKKAPKDTQERQMGFTDAWTKWK